MQILDGTTYFDVPCLQAGDDEVSHDVCRLLVNTVIYLYIFFCCVFPGEQFYTFQTVIYLLLIECCIILQTYKASAIFCGS